MLTGALKIASCSYGLMKFYTKHGNYNASFMHEMQMILGAQKPACFSNTIGISIKQNSYSLQLSI